MPGKIKGEKILWAGLGFIFIFFTLAAGHLLMVAINSVDYFLSEEFYQDNGIEGRWFGDTTLEEELVQEIDKAELKKNQEKIDVLQQGLEELKSSGKLEFHMLRVSPFLLFTTFLIILTGIALMVLTRYQENEFTQTVTGIFSGLLIWTGAVEYGLLIAARILGVAKGLNVHGELIVGEFGEYVLLKYTWGLLLMIMLYLFYMEGVRCNFFVTCREITNQVKGKPIVGCVYNYGPRVAFFYSSTMWFFYVLLLIAYDPSIFGPQSWFTKAIFFLSLAGTLYLFYRLMRQHSFASAIRYSIPVAMVFWNDVEIIAKWGLLNEPWLILNPMNAISFFGGLIAGTYLILRHYKNEQKKKESKVS